jgi:hypothetical protein
VHVEPRTLGQPGADERGFVRPVVFRDEGTSTAAGTLASIRSRNLRNSIDRCRRCVSAMTVPVLALSAANKDVVPWRL